MTSAKFFAINRETGKKNSANVWVQYPIKKTKASVQSVIDRHPAHKFTLNQVSAALAKIGASFVPWSDGKPGYDRVYR